MNQASPEGNFSSREDTLLKNTTENPSVPVPVTSDIIIPGYDSDSRKISPEMKRSLLYASHEAENFVAIDEHVDGFIGVLGKDLSEIQAVTTDPSILIRQAEHLMEATDQLIDGATADKVSIRQRNQENLGKTVMRGVANEDLIETPNERHKRIVEVLLANRSAREGLLQERVNDLQANIDKYRQYLSEMDPAQLVVFNAHFETVKAEEETELPAVHVHDEIVTPTTAEMEAHFEQVTDETVSPARGIALLGSRALQKLVINPVKRSWEYLVPTPSGEQLEYESQLQNLR